MSDYVADEVVREVFTAQVFADRVTIQFKDGSAVRLIPDLDENTKIDIQALSPEGAELDMDGELPLRLSEVQALERQLEAEHERAAKKVRDMSDQELLRVWNGLQEYDPYEEYNDALSMDDWARIVYSEKSRRGL